MSTIIIRCKTARPASQTEMLCTASCASLTYPCSLRGTLTRTLSHRYTQACSRLLAQYKGLIKLLPPSDFPSLEAFMTRFRVRVFLPPTVSFLSLISRLHLAVICQTILDGQSCCGSPAQSWGTGHC